MRFLLLAMLLLTGCGQAPPVGQQPSATASPQSHDPAMEAAVAEARQRFPEFRRRVAAAAPGEQFYVKLPFQTPDKKYTEFMWLRVTSLEGDTGTGVLENEPVEVKTIKAGESVQFPASEVEDWGVTDARGKALAGQFTVKAMK